MLSNDYELPAFNLMDKSKNKEMFKNQSDISHLIKIRNADLKEKRRIVLMSNTPLFYIFGYKLESKPWQTIEERYGII